jgi:isopenicillin N synthase-like dioxygenase
MQIPVIDIGRFTSRDAADRQRVAREWDEAFSTAGFATIAGHGIPEPLLAEVWNLSQAFFALPLAEKMEIHGGANFGYQSFEEAKVGRTRDKATPPDLVEALMFQNPIWERRSDEPTVNLWPTHPTRFRGIVERYIDEAYALGQTLMRITAIALGLPDGYFDRHYARMAHDLRLAYYPDQPVAPPEGQLRNGPHTDFRGFTILRQDDAPGGLQVLGADGDWVDVRPVPGTLVINSGDLLQRWTNDRWRSNLHRVVNPPRNVTGTTARLSMVFFTGPDPRTMIECLPTCAGNDRPARYAPIMAQDHFLKRLREAFG